VQFDGELVWTKIKGKTYQANNVVQETEKKPKDWIILKDEILLERRVKMGWQKLLKE